MNISTADSHTSIHLLHEPGHAQRPREKIVISRSEVRRFLTPYGRGDTLAQVSAYVGQRRTASDMFGMMLRVADQGRKRV